MTRLERIAMEAFPELEVDDAAWLVRDFLRREIRRRARQAGVTVQPPRDESKFSEPTDRERQWVADLPALERNQLLTAVAALSP